MKILKLKALKSKPWIKIFEKDANNYFCGIMESFNNLRATITQICETIGIYFEEHPEVRTKLEINRRNLKNENNSQLFTSLLADGSVYIPVQELQKFKWNF